jgi:hypothetical protein
MPNRTRNRTNPNQVLLMLIVVLAVLLVGVICVALTIGAGEVGDNQTPTEQTPSESTDPTYTYPDSLILTTAPAQQEMTVMVDKLTFEGAFDPSQTLLINGLKIIPGEDGSFSHRIFEAGQQRDHPVLWRTGSGVQNHPALRGGKLRASGRPEVQQRRNGAVQSVRPWRQQGRGQLQWQDHRTAGR